MRTACLPELDLISVPRIKRSVVEDKEGLDRIKQRDDDPVYPIFGGSSVIPSRVSNDDDRPYKVIKLIKVGKFHYVDEEAFYFLRSKFLLMPRTTIMMGKISQAFENFMQSYKLHEIQLLYYYRVKLDTVMAVMLAVDDVMTSCVSLRSAMPDLNKYSKMVVEGVFAYPWWAFWRTNRVMYKAPKDK